MLRIYTMQVKRNQRTLTYRIDPMRAERAWDRHVKQGGLDPRKHPFAPTALYQSVITDNGYVEARRDQLWRLSA